MSRSSTLALAAFAGALGSGGAVGTAEAASVTITGPGPFGHVHISNPQEFVLIENGAFLGIDPNPGGTTSFLNDAGNVIFGTGTPEVGVGIYDSTLQGSFSNRGTIFGDDGGVYIGEAVGGTGSTLLSGFTNTGLISSDSSDGVDIESTNLSGGFTNSGRILGGTGLNSGAGLEVENFEASSRTFSGGITNSGTISGEHGIYFGGKTGAIVFEGGIHNSGNIAGDSDTALSLGNVVTFSGGITNTSTGKIISLLDAGIQIEAESFTGGIHNQGTIDGNGGDGIELTDLNDSFSGGVTNSGLIEGSADGIEVATDVFGDPLGSGQGILNQASGTIRGVQDGIEITDDVTTFNGGISNAGLIESANETGIEIAASTFNGGIVNSGTIEGDDIGIRVRDTVFNGGISNTLTSKIESNGDAIRVASSAIFSNSVTPAGINNAGLIRSVTWDGIDIEALTFWGGVTNSGTILAGDTGIEIGEGFGEVFNGGVTNSGLITADDTGIDIWVQDFNGGVTNSGDINASFRGIDIDADTFDGGVHNQADGEIIANSGINVSVADTFDGGVHNAGTITAENGDGIHIDPDVFNGGVTNSGLITADQGTGIYIQATDLHGKIVNTQTGRIVASGDDTNSRGIYVDATNVHDGLENAGQITVSGSSSGSTAILVEATTFAGGLTNSGTITAHDGTGVRLDITQTFEGGLTNSGTITSDSSDAIHVDVDATFSGGITNSGSLFAGDDGIRTEGGSFAGGIHNTLSGLISADETGIDIDNATFTGGVTNAGRVIVDGGGIEVDSTTFSGGILNTGTIEANFGIGIDVDVTTFNGGISNSGQILASDDGFEISGTTFNGGFNNSGTIQVDGTGVLTDVSTFNNGFSNSGLISANTMGVDIDVSNMNGGFANSGRIAAQSYGVDIDTTTWANGNFSNSGTIESVSYTAVDLDADTFTGNFVNSGTIQSGNYTAVSIDIDAFNGGFTNSGLIHGDTSGVEITNTNMTGNFVNSGTILTNTQTAVYLSSTTINGFLTNSGLIQSNTEDGIYVSGEHIAGGIFNSGTIIAPDDAIDVSGADTGHTITQTAGVIEGDIELDNGYKDVLNMNGGTLEGDINSDISDEDVLNVAAGSGSFAYLSGVIDDLDVLNVNSGTAIMGGPAVGTNGDGVITGGEGINDINVNGGALYLDDDTFLTANDTYDQDAGGEVQFLLSRDTDDNAISGQVFAATALIDGTISGVVDLEAFSLGNVADFFTYEDVIDAGSLAGTFDNVGVFDDLIFFDLQVGYDGDDNVDLYLERFSFAEVLAAASQSSNQQAVGAVLEEIFDNGGFSGDFAEAFEDLLGSSSYDEALAIYDQLLGADHAQAALGAMNAMGQFQGFLGERMDVLHNGMGSAQWAMFGQPGTQVAMAETVLADASPSPAVGGGSMVTTRNGNTISMFGGIHGNWMSVEGDTNGPGFDQDTFGISGGVDYAISSESIVGMGGSYMTSELEFETANSGDVDTFAVGLFGTFGLGGGYLDANGNVAFHDLSTTRSTPGADAHGEYSATSWSLSGEVGTVIPVGRAYVSPMLSLTYVGLSVDGFTETDSAFALAVQGSDTDSFATVLGARAGDYFKVGKATVNLQGNLGWRHEFGDDKASFTGAFLEDPSLLFNVDSSKIASDSATFGVGSTVSISSRLEVYVNYDGVWNAEADSHNASLGVRANW